MEFAEFAFGAVIFGGFVYLLYFRKKNGRWPGMKAKSKDGKGTGGGSKGQPKNEA